MLSFLVISKHRKTLEAIRAEPVNGNLEWARVEALLAALGCCVVKAVREFLEYMGAKP